MHTIAAILLGPTATGTLLKGIENSQLSGGLKKILLAGSGQVEAPHGGIVEVKPSLNFSTTAIKTALANFGGADGIAIVPTTAELAFWYQKAAAGGLRAAGANHIKATATVGIIVPQTLTMPAGSHASISYQAIFLSPDGTTLPLVIAGSQALDANQGGADEAFVLGPVSLNGTVLENVSEVSYDFGLTLFEGVANPYLKDISINSRRPKFNITTHDADEFASWGLLGQAQDDTDSVISLYPVTEGGVPASSGAITFTVDQGHMHYESAGGQHGEKFTGTVQLAPSYDGTAAPVAIGGLV